LKKKEEIFNGLMMMMMMMSNIVREINSRWAGYIARMGK